MANEKKVFSIQINGIKESTDAIAFLNDQLKDLEKNIKDLEKKQIKIKSGTSTSGSGSKSNKSQLTEEQKIQQQINKEIEKRAAMQTKEYQELLKQKQATKDIATEQKQISSGALAFDDTGAKEYTNTLAGMKAQLAALKAESQNFDLSGWTGEIDDLPDSVKKANEAIKQLSDRIKSFEQSQGTFSRGVGDYYNEFKRALADANKEIEKSGKTLQGLQQRQSALKGLINTTQIGTKEWEQYKKELSDVNRQLNSLGSGFRAEDIINPKVVITVNDLKLEFDDLGQSVSVLEDKLYQLRIEGKANTEEYQNIVNELQKVKQTIRETDDEIDALTSRTRGLDMVVGAFQGLTAAMQVGAGVAGLFGKSEEDLQKTLQKVTSLMSIAQGLQEIHNQLTQKGTLLNKAWQLSLAGAQKVINLFSKTQKAATASTVTNTSAIAANAAATTATATATTVATTATKVFTIAMKGLKLAIASTGIGLLVIALGELVSWLMKGSDQTERFEKSMKNMESQITATSNRLKNSFSDIDISVALGNESELNGLLRKLKDIESQYSSIGKIIRDIAVKQYLNSGTNKYKEEAKKYGTELENVAKQYDKVLDKQKKGIDNTKDYEKELADIQASYVKLLTASLEFVSNTESQQRAMQQLAYIYNQLNETAIGKTVTSNLENILPKKEDAERLKNYLSIVNEFGEEYINIENDIRKKVADIRKKTEEDGLEAIDNEYKRRLAEIKKNREAELKEVSHVRMNITNIAGLGTADIDLKEAEAAINKKYDRQELEARKSFAKEVANVEKSIQNNKISIMKEGLDKTIAQLELNRKSEIEAAKETGIKVGEQTKSINAKYDAEILKAKEAFYKQREEQYKQFAENYRQISNSFYEYEYQKSTQQVNVGLEASIGETSFDTDKSLNESVNEQRAFYEKLIQLKQDAALKLAEINLNKVTDDKYDSLQTENQRYQERLKLLEDYQKQGIITNEEYNTQLEHEQQQHADMVKQIEEQAWNKQLEIDRNYVNERKQIIAEGNNGVIQSFNDYFNEIQRLEDKAITPNKNTGIINYKDTKANLTKVKQEYKSLMDNIKQQLNTLEQEFANGKISFDDFKTAKKELKSLEDSVNQSMENVNQTLSTLVVTVADSISQFVGQYLGVLSGLWSTYNDIVMSSLDYQQEMLEEEYDMLEDAYQKQEELVQKHTNKLDEIESELKDSRGDRRQHLIDQLAAEREAQIAALAEEQKIAKQKEQNQKKQDALEKKRREQEKKNSIVQATINTFTAMTNALAVQPWFVGLALSAVALAMGMAQVANIKKQKYADGGLLNGKSHKQGGIPVGNTGIEVEGNEYVVNKKSTEKNLPLIEYINSNRRTLTRDDLVTFFDNGKQSLVNKKVRAKYADGGQLPEIGEIDVKSLINYEPEQDNQVVQVQVVDIINATENVKKVQVLSGL